MAHPAITPYTRFVCITMDSIVGASHLPQDPDQGLHDPDFPEYAPICASDYSLACEEFFMRWDTLAVERVRPV